MTGVPSAMTVEVLFGSTWTDVSSYTAGSVAQIHYGRLSPFSDATTASLSGIVLDNTDGRFTPLCDLLVDGVTANPYYPNVLPRAQIRLSYSASGTKYFYWGFIQSWPPTRLNGDGQFVVNLTAVCGLSILSGISVVSAPQSAALLDSPIVFYGFNDTASGSLSWLDAVAGRHAWSYSTARGEATYGPGTVCTALSDGLVGLQVSAVPVSFGNGAGWRSDPIPTVSAMNTTWTVEGWLTQGVDASQDFADAVIQVASAANDTFVYLQTETNGFTGQFWVRPEYSDAAGLTSFTDVEISDALPHYYVLTGSDVAGTLTLNLYVDNVLRQTQTATGGSCTLGASSVQLWGLAFNEFSNPSPPVTFADVALYETVLTGAQMTAHYAAGAGGLGQTTGQRIAEMFRWFGIPNSAVATGVQTVTNHTLAGKTLLAACQDMARTEGGGSVIYNDPATGLNTFLDRHFRSTTTPLFTVDTEADLDGAQFQPAFDSLTLVNQSTLQRPGGAAQTYTDAASVALYGVSTDQGGAVYPDTDQAVLNLAQERVNSQKQPAFRIGKLPIDLMTAMTAGLYPLFGAIKIGSRVRTINLVAAQTAPLTTADVYVEGWTLTAAADQFMAVLDTTPADNPAVRGQWDIMRWSPTSGDFKLNASITASATALAMKWTIGPKATTTAGSYPVYVRIDQEVIELPNPPSGSTSPQSFTGAVRGALGTRQAPHAANAVISAVNGNWQL